MSKSDSSQTISISWKKTCQHCSAMHHPQGIVFLCSSTEGVQRKASKDRGRERLLLPRPRWLCNLFKGTGLDRYVHLPEFAKRLGSSRDESAPREVHEHQILGVLQLVGGQLWKEHLTEWGGEMQREYFHYPQDALTVEVLQRCQFQEAVPVRCAEDRGKVGSGKQSERTAARINISLTQHFFVPLFPEGTSLENLLCSSAGVQRWEKRSSAGVIVQFLCLGLSPSLITFNKKQNTKHVLRQKWLF